jgi:CDP-glucose 4,6-dehydratase
MRRALVTGGQGFVGSHVAAGLLGAGVEVRVLDRPGPARTALGGSRPSGLAVLGIAGEVDLVEGDLLDPGAATAAVAGCDTVFHFAAQTIAAIAGSDPTATLDINVRGSWNVFEACRTAAVERVVYSSSYKAYGTAPELPYREDFPLRAAYPYDASKAAADTIARGYASTYGLPLAVTRFANIYGEADLNFTRLVPETAIAVAAGQAPQIRSDGSPKRDFLHIDDAVAAYLAVVAALDSGEARGEAFNAGGDGPHSVREVVEAVVAAGGGEVEPRWGAPPAGEIVDQYLDSTKLRELTGWRPAVGLRAGLERTLEWYREHEEVRP